MNCNAGAVRVVANLMRDFRRINRAAGHIVGVFQRDQGRLRAVVDLCPNRPGDRFPA